jgi:Transposase DDE domain group 1
LVERFAACFTDARAPELTEHRVSTMVGQRIFGIALGYEDLIDHDQLRPDPTLAVLAGKLAARRKDCAPLAGKSTLNRLELGGAELTRYPRIAWDGAKIEALFVDLFLEAHQQPPPQIILDLDATDDPLHAIRKAASFTAIMIVIVICRCTSSAEPICWRSNSAVPTSTLLPARSRRRRASSRRSTPAGLKCALCCGPLRGLPATG